jgi:hypothetical protein
MGMRWYIDTKSVNFQSREHNIQYENTKCRVTRVKNKETPAAHVHTSACSLSK